MRTTLSTQMLEAINAESSGEVILPLVRLTQVDWADAIRLVPNTEQVVHMGEVFEPLAFEVGMPDEEAQGVPVLEWVADNSDRRLVEALRAVRGAVQVGIMWVLASDPDHIQMGPGDLEMRVAEYNAQSISGTLGVEPILDMQFGYLTMNTTTTPALF
ncbi:DUF1833 family protein [uncultured Tateyamaria sp.]|uniref:DUF1833 family protein n=1 Tax=Tateyamaria sp. 1078 TaxID=3417464 RepID=UPI00263272D3|nr:DUF1833 family protein [uncultured Tateyamaria sp.]